MTAASRMGAARAVFLVLVGAPVGCAPAIPATRPAISPYVARPGRESTRPSGSIRVTVRWPERRAHAIPADGVRIDIAAFVTGAILPVGAATLERGGGQFETTAEIKPVPAGTITINAAARDEVGAVLASGTTVYELRPNEIATVRLALVPTKKPAITGISPANGVPGTTVTVFGGAFGEVSAYPFAVFLGTGSFEVATASRLSDGMIIFPLPAGAPIGPIVVRVAGLTATSSATFVPIASLSLKPEQAQTFAPNGLVDLTIAAWDPAGDPVAAPAVPFDIVSKSGCPAACAGGDSLRADGDGGELNIGDEPGTLRIEAGSGSVKTVAIVKVEPLGRGHLKEGLGPLPAVPAPADNAVTPARVTLGTKLFGDPKLSRSQAMSCATCHDPTRAFTDGRRFGLGNDGKDLPRHTPTILNAAYGSLFFWDGRATSLEAQTLGVVGSPRQFDSDVPAMEAYLQASASYVSMFQDAYQAPPSLALVAKAIASYERTLVSPARTAPFDKWAAGDDTALSAAAFRGLGSFLGKARCIACHTGPAFTDGKFHNVAVEGSGTLDKGRFGVTGMQADLGAFKTPTLRNVALTAPYFHDGSAATLDDAVRQYEIFRRDFENKSPLLKTVFFVGTDRADMVEFQKALTATP